MRNLSRAITGGAVAIGAVALIAASQQQGQDNKRAAAERTIATWPADSKKAGQAMLAKYGAPDAVGEKVLVWQGTGPWKETVLMRDPIEHQWPMPHKDVLAQTVDYKVPPDKFDELANYDGSVIAERTRGTLTARCDKEEANFLAINLANDVATGKKTVEEARQMYAEVAAAFMKGEKHDYLSGFRFSPTSGTADPDRPHQPKVGDR